MAGVNADEHLLLYTFAAIWRPHAVRAFNFAVLQRAFLVFDEESLRRDNQRSSSFRETVGDRLGGIAEQLDESGQGARIHVVHVGAGVERRDFDAAQAVGGQGLQPGFRRGAGAEGAGRRADDQQAQARQVLRFHVAHAQGEDLRLGCQRVADGAANGARDLFRVAEEGVVDDQGSHRARPPVDERVVARVLLVDIRRPSEKVASAHRALVDAQARHLLSLLNHSIKTS